MHNSVMDSPSATLDTFVAPTAPVVVEPSTESLPETRVIRLTLNGQAHQVQVEPDWTLYHLIHDRLGLTGTKMFCDRGACGSCTVILNGRPVLSCMTLAMACDGKTIETIEGIAAAHHPLLDAYVKHHALQCGYCTPGMLMSAAAHLDENPSPTEEEVKVALQGNICRCTGYWNIVEAVHEAIRSMAEGGEG